MKTHSLHFTEQPHRRRNALTGEWVLVSPQRTKRPWQGKQETPQPEHRLPYDAECYLCPGNARASGERNPVYTGTYVFTNDFAALLPDTPRLNPDSSGPGHSAVSAPVVTYENVQGTSRVLCFSPRHDLTLPEMTREEIRCVVDAWIEETARLGKQYRWVQVFENKGEIMGCSNPHPHGQIWAGTALPNEPTKEEHQQSEFLKEHKSVLLLDYLSYELEQQERIIVENTHWVAVVPHWAIWPFEALLLPRRHMQRLPALEISERDALADIMKRLLTRFDNLFNVSFPYTMGWHGAPFGEGNVEHWQLHAHIYPPLLRSSTVKKFMVGYEMLSEAQRDITPEQAAERLRAASEVHYRHAASATTRT